ncbi:MAG: type II secretion system protein [Clostridia bacterium]|nr:type II secretion system protein [Clostridia bacterium]
MKKDKAITLITLVITIVVLIILAGVVIYLSLGNNGILKRAKEASQKYELEQIKEKVEIGILEVQTREENLKNEITIESMLQELLDNNIFENIDKNERLGYIGEYEVKLKYNGNNSIVIESIQKSTGVRVVYKLEPSTYTNGDIVSILFRVQGKVKSVTKPDNLKSYSNKNIISIDYKVDKNGTYQFIIENEEGTTTTKDVIVDIIDRLPPKEFEITATQVENKLVITSNAEDAEADGTSVKSGIDKLEYFIKKSTETNYPETFYTTNEIEGLAYDTYTVYAKAYDKAGNCIQSSNEATVTISNSKVAKYGKRVNYSANGVTDWKVFYIEDDETKPNYGCTYIITSDYLNYYEMEDTSPITDLNMKLYKGNYCLNWSKSTIPTYNANIDIPTDIESGYIGIRDMFLYKWNGVTSNTNVKCASALLNTIAWSPFASGTSHGVPITGAYAVGASTAEMWVASWNDSYPNVPLKLTAKKNGYSIDDATRFGFEK